MGISGLLPLLKSIQVNKHLRDLAGQTIAIDAYVWLHRGIMSCAVELATGKPTTKYVDYAMHRVRMLRHYDIDPYVVFDGGPLPAKLGTENHRQQDRDEARVRGDAFTKEGRHQEARESYLKSIDVTPQMAYQLIKALRAESVPYIVAPYEADAQLAYLESRGIVDGIITEDSDLLVFGCKNVFFKFDSSTCRLDAISRVDFAALTAKKASSSNGISLHGWSDTQFRAMAILSGCDYLPSIPNVGIKTAYSLLRQHKTPNNVVRAIRLEGKKAVPKGYEALFRRAEMVFLHQRVYDPTAEKLVHLRERPAGDEVEWTVDIDAYVGAEIEPALAKKLAMGDVDPCTLQPMVDINPAYKPRPFKSAQKYIPKANTMPQKTASAGILGYFAPKPKLAPVSSSAPASTAKAIPVVNPIPAVKTTVKPVAKVVAAGRASGKRTLVEVMDLDMDAAAAKRRKSTETTLVATKSRFFTGEQAAQPVAGPSRLTVNEKENLPLYREDDDDIEIIEVMTSADPVTQEDGYMSPSGDWDESEGVLSSPRQGVREHSREVTTPKRVKRSPSEDFIDVDAISSPLGKQFAFVAPNRRRPAALPREKAPPHMDVKASLDSLPSFPSPKPTFMDVKPLSLDSLPSFPSPEPTFTEMKPKQASLDSPPSFPSPKPTSTPSKGNVLAEDTPEVQITPKQERLAPLPQVDLADTFGDFDQSSDIDEFEDDESRARLDVQNRVVQEEGELFALKAAQSRQKAALERREAEENRAAAMQIDASWRTKYSFQATAGTLPRRHNVHLTPQAPGRHNLGINSATAFARGAPSPARAMWDIPMSARGDRSVGGRHF